MPPLGRPQRARKSPLCPDTIQVRRSQSHPLVEHPLHKLRCDNVERDNEPDAEQDHKWHRAKPQQRSQRRKRDDHRDDNN